MAQYSLLNIELYVIICLFKEKTMDNTKESSLEETKEKLKQVANCWSKITELGKTAVYDINDPNVNWEKEIEQSEIEEIVDKRISIDDPKPKKLPEEPTKRPKYKSDAIQIISIFLFTTIFVISFLGGMAANAMSEFSFSSLLDYSIIFLGLLLSGIGITLNKKYSTAIKCKKIIEKNNLAVDEKVTKRLNKSSKKFILVFGVIFIALGLLFLTLGVPVFVPYMMDIDHSNEIGELVAGLISIFSSIILFSCSISFSINKRKNELNTLIYRAVLKECENNKKFNQEEYPKLLQEWENKMDTLRESSLKEIKDTHKQIEKLFNQIEEINIVSKSQAQYAQALIDSMFRGAESIKEAFQMIGQNPYEDNLNAVSAPAIETKPEKIMACASSSAKIATTLYDERNKEEDEQEIVGDKIEFENNKYIKKSEGEKDMIYNKTKRTLELVAAIFALVMGIGMLGVSLYLFGTGIMLASVFAAVGMISLALPFLIPGILFLATSVCSIVFGAMLIKSPVRPEGVLNTKTKQICLIVFSILSGNLVSFVLEIIVVCLPNFVDPNKYAQTSASNAKYLQPNPQYTPAGQTAQNQYAPSNGVEGKINELKHLKELGVIDEQAYNKAVDKIISEIR